MIIYSTFYKKKMEANEFMNKIINDHKDEDIKKHLNEDYIMFYKHNDMLVEVSFFNLREIKTYGDE